MGHSDKIAEWNEKYAFMWRKISLSLGILLLIGLSSNHLYVRHFVVLLLIGTVCYEASWLRSSKMIGHSQWRISLIIMGVSALVYVSAQNYGLKTYFFWSMIASGLIYLYRLCYSEALSWNYVIQMVNDSVYLMLCYFVDMWRIKKNILIMEKDRKILGGILGAFVVLFFGLIPLYVLGDIHFRGLVKVCFYTGVEVVPIVFSCMIFGIIPAMFNYSYMKGLYTDLVLENPGRKTGEYRTGNTGFYFNEITMKIIIIAVLLVNTVFMITQIVFLLSSSRYNVNAEEVDHMRGVYLIGLAVILNIVVIGMCEYLFWKKPEAKLRYWVFWDALVTVVIMFSVVYRYVESIVRYGIHSIEIFSGITFLCIMIGLIFALTLTWKKKINVFQKALNWICITLIILSLTPFEYIIPEINVGIFQYKYQNNLAEAVIREHDLDMDYLRQFRYQAIPAMSKLKTINNPYEGKNKSVAELSAEYIWGIFKEDIKEQDYRELMRNEDITKRLRNMTMILEKKSEYQILGYKRHALEAVKEMVEE